jgi:ElaB/YqjD/DUF883 family membrane-anchored ribosome-binding protein
MYEPRDRTGVIASGSLEQIRAKVHELSHHERQHHRLRDSDNAQRRIAVQTATDRYLEARARAGTRTPCIE